jgi:uncharacterized protein with HEPN domain
MRPKTPKLLEDIRDAAAYIGELARGRTLEDDQRDRMLRQAVERNFEIIGEAVGRLIRLDPDTAARISSHRQIVDFRNLLIYGYDLIDHRIVWSTVAEKIPLLVAEVESLLGVGT